MDWRPYTRDPSKFGLVYTNGKWVDPEEFIEEGIEIFSRIWREKDQARKDMVLFRNNQDKEFRMSYILDFIPWSFRDIVCICDLFGTGTKKCPRCNKYARWKFMRSCKSCSKPFIKDFYHPEDKGSRCFDCLVAEYGLMGGENFVTVKPKELADLNAEGVFDLPDIPTFNF